MNQEMQFVQDGINLLKFWEGCRLMSYVDLVGLLTIGYGHTGNDVRSGMAITQEQAENILEQDIRQASEQVRNIVHSCLNDNQFSAAVCFAYNVRGWAATPLFGFLVRGEVEKAKEHWLLYDKAVVRGQKIEVQGLKNRRQAELDLFCKPIGVS
jgi:lysozyme